MEGVCSCTFSESNMYDNQIVCLHISKIDEDLYYNYIITHTVFWKRILVHFYVCKDCADDNSLAGPVVL